MGYHFSSQLKSPLTFVWFSSKITWALAILLEYLHKKFEINRAKIKGGCQSGRKVVTHNSKSDLPLEKEKKNTLKSYDSETGKKFKTTDMISILSSSVYWNIPKKRKEKDVILFFSSLKPRNVPSKYYHENTSYKNRHFMVTSGEIIALHVECRLSNGWGIYLFTGHFSGHWIFLAFCAGKKLTLAFARLLMPLLYF